MSIMETKLTTVVQVSQVNRKAVYVVVGGILGMIIAMGIGRFSFTPILPLMQRDLGISHSVAGWLATLNYLGYLFGAIGCFAVPQLIRSRSAAIIALLFCIATTIGMGCTVSVVWWGVMRCLAGAASAMLFIVIAAETSEILTRLGRGHWVGVVYGGVGVGIALSGIAVPWLDHLGPWDDVWISLGIIAVFLAMIAIPLAIDELSDHSVAAVPVGQPVSLVRLWMLVVAYFFEGLGYVVTATFLVTMIAQKPGFESLAFYSWVIVGVAAVPSTVLWPLLALRIGNQNVLLIAFGLQAFGILVSILSHTILGCMIAAVAFGGTFMGITAMVLSEGQSRINHDTKKATAVLTASFGVGQVLGPVLAGRLADLHNGFALPLFLATICILIGWLFIAFDRYSSGHS